MAKRLHWTQKPENKSRLNFNKKKETKHQLINEYTRLLKDAQARVNSINEEITKLQVERHTLTTAFNLEKEYEHAADAK